MAFSDFNTPFPIIQAPMAGGVSTPDLAVAVCEAGGLGFLAAGYKSAEAMRAEIAATRNMTDRAFGVNVFVPDHAPVSFPAIEAYRERIGADAERLGVKLPDPYLLDVADDDDWPAKMKILTEDPVPVVSFTFGCPAAEDIERLRAVGSNVVITVTTPEEAEAAARAGADALCVQGMEAGGHRASFENRDGPDYGLLVLIRLVSERVDLPLIAAGGIMRAADVAAVLAAGAEGVQVGTAFLRCPEAGTHPVHRSALADPDFSETAVTRAFTGRRARGLVNRFMVDHGPVAPAAYPQLHHLTKDLRRAAGAAGDPHAMSMWAGQGFRLAEELPAADVVLRLAGDL
jgi:nitronate monooxygenase